MHTMENKIKVLLAEDDRNLGNILRSYLEAKGYPTRLCVNGQEALEVFREGEVNFCIIDVMMPVKDGFTLAQEIRAIDKLVPILFVTAKSLQEDVLKGFQAGADDYITKPFSMEELLARMSAVLRRALPDELAQDKQVFRIGGYVFDHIRQTLTIGEKSQKLTTREADLLRLLCLNLNQVLDRTAALQTIWHDDSYFNARSMDVYITKLRKYLKEDPRVNLLNVHGVGFKLVVG